MRPIVRARLGSASMLVAALALAGCAGAPGGSEPTGGPESASRAASPPEAPVESADPSAVTETEPAAPVDAETPADVPSHPESERPSAEAFDPSQPPRLVARLAADVAVDLELDPVSYCTPGLCADGSPRPPTAYLRAGPGDVIQVELVDAVAGAGDRCVRYCIPGLLGLWPLECVDGVDARFGDAVLVAPFAGREGRLRLDAPAGSYLLSAFVYWNREDGTSGDVFAMGGVRITRDGEAGVVSAPDAGCRPPRQPKRLPLDRVPPGEDVPACPDATASLDSLLPAATTVFVGTVTETGPAADPGAGSSARLVRVAVTEPLRGTVDASVELAWPACAGDPSGRTYLVLAGASGQTQRPLALLGSYLVDAEAGEATSPGGETVEVQAVIDRVVAGG